MHPPACLLVLPLPSFWQKVHFLISQITGWSLPHDNDLFVPHHSNIPLQKYKYTIQRLLDVLDAAKACVPAFWKSSTPIIVSPNGFPGSMKLCTWNTWKPPKRETSLWFYWPHYTFSTNYACLMDVHTLFPSLVLPTMWSEWVQDLEEVINKKMSFTVMFSQYFFSDSMNCCYRLYLYLRTLTICLPYSVNYFIPCLNTL